MRILTVVGARPQFIKASVVSLALSKQGGFDECILHTGQHFDDNMSEIFFRELGIPEPRLRLDIHGGGHGEMTGRMLQALESCILDQKPEMVMVYGDTNSTLAGALAAAKLNVPVAHVEAGLRSYDRRMPEEVNRVLTDHLAKLLFCPTDVAISNLRAEGIPSSSGVGQVFKVGDVMEDSTKLFVELSRRPSAALPDKPFILATLHRAENTDDAVRLSTLVNALNKLAMMAPVVFPMHPRTRQAIERANVKPTFNVIPPVGYLEMLWLVQNCGLVLTDSGGLQKEAYFLGKYCLTCRDTTEWTELVSIGANSLVSTSESEILQLADARFGTTLTPDSLLYGGGTASNRIAAVLSEAA